MLSLRIVSIKYQLPIFGVICPESVLYFASLDSAWSQASNEYSFERMHVKECSLFSRPRA